MLGLEVEFELLLELLELLELPELDEPDELDEPPPEPEPELPPPPRAIEGVTTKPKARLVTNKERVF
jgi:hypothetical protein